MKRGMIVVTEDGVVTTTVDEGGGLAECRTHGKLVREIVYDAARVLCEFLDIPYADFATEQKRIALRDQNSAAIRESVEEALDRLKKEGLV